MPDQAVYSYNLSTWFYVLASSWEEAQEIVSETFKNKTEFKSYFQLTPELSKLYLDQDEVLESVKDVEDWCNWVLDAPVMGSCENLGVTLDQIDDHVELEERFYNLMSKDSEILKKQIRLLEDFDDEVSQ